MNWTIEELQERLKSNPALKCRDHIEQSHEMAGTILRPCVKGGWREDLQKYFRSSWEANYARYLNFIKESWEYEVKEWEFPIKRGQRFYRCDFYLPRLDEYIEIKGWMDKKSAVKLRRMTKYYPEVKIKVIGKEEYQAIAESKSLIPGWE
jgi:hypothetical protein